MSKILVLYDSWCPICMRVKENIHKLDWFNLIELKSIREENNLNIPITDLEKEMYCINVETGKITKGIDAIASISARLPLMILFWLPVNLWSFRYLWSEEKRSLIFLAYWQIYFCELLSVRYVLTLFPYLY
ncbi:DCC1-like thiol-disulfide oxidoreductase family protein [Anoxybacillus rupiensis]|uniref:DCC1-like thiol-disulfide oxidoreductase family protein n=1 Tax=Anoxybacteroides rupiense TaxID=311460 RepID=A0ABD5IZP8_9BACL|nr:DCC1-like thiol-disulfide oxidoreductase family protein [Anoxybacillus rupiensis]